MTTIQLCLLRLFHIASVSGSWEARFGHHHASDVNAVIHWYGQRKNMRCSCSTDAYDVKQVLKTFKSAFMLLLVKKEQHSLFNHTSLFICYRHLNNRSTRDAPNVQTLLLGSCSVTFLLVKACANAIRATNIFLNSSESFINLLSYKDALRSSWLLRVSAKIKFHQHS